ncbi:MAG TPA: NAD(P)H:quinone oxidoreductase [Paenibacillus sp.]|nr:NAD(P)H:quinone oxidoreductase [Paenibacillus sp.]
MTVNLAVVYYSSTGANHQLAQWAAEAGRDEGAEVKLLRAAELAPQSVIDKVPLWKAHAEATKDIPVVTTDDIVWADAILFSTPTRFGVMASQLKQFLDTTGGIFFQGLTANKVVSAMSSAENPHGGQEATILSLYTMMYHWGAIVVTPGYMDASIFAAGGNPYGTSVTVDAETKKLKEDVRGAVRYQTKRVVEVANWIKRGKS